MPGSGTTTGGGSDRVTGVPVARAPPTGNQIEDGMKSGSPSTGSDFWAAGCGVNGNSNGEL